MPLLANVIIATKRSGYTAPTIAGTSGTTGQYSAYLTNVLAHAEPMDTIKYAGFGDDALSCDYVVIVDSGTDILQHDRIGSMVLLSDGSTNWPDDLVYSNPHDFLDVIYIAEQAALLLPARILFVKRVLGGGSH